MTMKVCVIGAGAAGLAVARHLASNPELFDFVVWEKSDTIGGQWNYTEDVSSKDGVHSSLYSNMTTNIPKEVMGFPGYPFHTEGSSFIHHTEVQNYLINFVDHFSLKKYINFGYKVCEVKPIKDELSDAVKWNVSVMKIGCKTVETDQYDNVIICNGRYTNPYIPDILGMETFKGDIIHSHYYRKNVSYVDKNVVCLGRGPSGLDISLEIGQVAKKVFISHNKSNLESPLPDNICQITGITRMNENSITFNDGQTFQVDSVVLCTGYMFDFAFLHKDCKIKIQENRVTPLFKHFINIEHPSLAFLGVPFTVCPFPFYDTQAKYYIKYLEGKADLPSKEEMYADEAKDFSVRLESGLPVRHAHFMSTRQWGYHDDIYQLGSMSGTAVSKVLRLLYDYIHQTRVKDLANYKKLSYVVEGDTFKLKN